MAPMFNKSLSSRIVFYVLSLCVVLFLISLMVFYASSKQQLEEMTYQYAEEVTQKTVLQTEQFLSPVVKLAEQAGWLCKQMLNQPDSITMLTLNMAANNPEIKGMAVAFEPSFYSQKGYYFSPYTYRQDDRLITMQLGSENYEYFYIDWYQIPMHTGSAYWSEPYYDTGGGDALMTTYSLPLYRGAAAEGKPFAIVKIDVALDWLTENVSSLKILETGYATVLSGNGIFVTHPNEALIMNQSIFSYASELNNAELREIGRSMQREKSGFVSSRLKGVERMIYFTRLPSSDWTIAVIFPKSEIYLPLHSITFILVVVLLVGLALLSIIISRIVKQQLNPLGKFAAAVNIIAEGNFNVALPGIKTNDEMKGLHDAFESMQHKLDHYIRSLTETTSLKEKIESELRIAREIQMSMIPKTFPPFPSRKEIDQFAVLIPAREVGGDLYDYYINENKLYFIIGDVSGKGIPSSLLMAVTRSLFRSISQYLTDAAAIMSGLNSMLAQNNDSNMFVTLFLGILDLETGNMSYCNAGHNPPLITTDTTRFFPVIPNLPLGIMDGFEFKKQEMQLSDNTRFLLYTDGITEAENVQQQLYGDERLLQFVAGTTFESPQALIEALLKDVQLHVDGAEQSDDLTMLALQFKGVQQKYEKSITLKNEIEQIALLQDFIEVTGEELGLESSLVMKLNLALEEAVSNVILYAYPRLPDKEIIVSVTLKTNDLIFTVTDTGVPFDPTLNENPDIHLPATERPVGGLGIFLIRQIMNEVTYSRIHDINVFTMKKRL